MNQEFGESWYPSWWADINGYVGCMTTLQFTNHRPPEEIVSSECIGMFSVRPQRMLSCLLTASCPPMWEWEAEADTGLHLMEASECCKQEWPGCHYTVFLKDVSRHSETAGSEGDRKLCFWITTLEALWISPAVRKGEQQNVEWRVTSVFPVCAPKLTIHPIQPSPQFICASERSWSHEASLAVTANPIYHDACSVTLTPTQHANIWYHGHCS